MKGSEKQIKWAKDIVAGQIEQLNSLVDDAAKRVENNNMPQEWLNVHKEGVERMVSSLEKQDDAKVIIDNRVNNLIQRVEMALGKEYQRRMVSK